MPDASVDAVLDAPPRAVLASLTAALRREGWRLCGVGGFGSVVTWQAFDASLELVTLRAELCACPSRRGASATRLRIARVDASLEAALGTTRPSSARLPRPRSAG